MGELRAPHGAGGRRSGLLTRFVAGLTGGIGSGKSTVAALLQGLGARVVDADRLVHRLYEPGGRGAAAVASLAGQDALDASGAVDRPRLASRLFADEDLRQRVEAAVHPLVMQEVAAWLATVPPEAVPVVEAALLVESGLHRAFALVVVVGVRPDVQRARLRQRHPDWTAEEAERRIQAQMPLEAKIRRLAADGVPHHLLDNSGTLAELEAACGRLHALLRAERDASGRRA